MVLKPTRIDRSICAVVPGIWIYLSAVFLFAVAVWVPNTFARTRAVVAMVLACAIAGVTFMLFPTTIPRLPLGASSITGCAWKFIYAVDTPYNAFPSLHAAFAMIATAALWRAGLVWRVTGLLWGTSVVGAALAVKQHFVLDVVASLYVGIVAHSLASIGLLWATGTNSNDCVNRIPRNKEES